MPPTATPEYITEYDPPVPLALSERWHEYDDVHTFRFLPAQHVSFYAGQNARIVISTLGEEEGRRSLSFASPPHETEVQFSLHLRPESTYKRALAALTNGDIVHLVKVKGETFIRKGETEPIVLIAGGVGITPFRSMLLDLHARSTEIDATLIHVSDTAYLYESDLTPLPYIQHRIRRFDLAAILAEVVVHRPSARYYLAGPPAFIERMQVDLVVHDIPETRIRHSRFTGYA